MLCPSCSFLACELLSALESRGECIMPAIRGPFCVVDMDMHLVGRGFRRFEGLYTIFLLTTSFRRFICLSIVGKMENAQSGFSGVKE
jgi:hypothetical protein